MENTKGEKGILIVAGGIVVTADIYDTVTGTTLYDILPVSAEGTRWGDEVYFSIPLELPSEPDCRDIVQKGDLGYWPGGRAFCMFFGPTPISSGSEIRAAFPVNIFGRITGDPMILSAVTDRQTITVSRR